MSPWADGLASVAWNHIGISCPRKSEQNHVQVENLRCVFFLSWCRHAVSGGSLAQGAVELWEWHVQYWEWTAKKKEDFDFSALPKDAKPVASIKLYRTETGHAAAITQIGNTIFKAAIFPDGTDAKWGPGTVVRLGISKLKTEDPRRGASVSNTVYRNRVGFGERKLLGGGGFNSDFYGFTLTVSKTGKKRANELWKDQ